MQRLYLYGASGHGKVIAEIAQELKIRIGGFIDDDPLKEKYFGYPVYHKLTTEQKGEKLIISIGNNSIRSKIANRFSTFEFESLIHPHTSISRSAQIGKGSVIMAGASINADVQIGKHAILNTNSSIDHECHLGDFVHISPNAGLAGNVIVGEGTHIGIGASVIQGIKIGKWCTIGAGAVIIRDVPDRTVMVGNPGKVIKSKNP